MDDPQWIRIWDTDTGKELLRLKGPEARYFSIGPVYSPDGAILVTGHSIEKPKEENALVIWDLANGKELRRLHCRAQDCCFADWRKDASGLGWALLVDLDVKTGAPGPSRGPP